MELKCMFSNMESIKVSMNDRQSGKIQYWYGISAVFAVHRTKSIEFNVHWNTKWLCAAMNDM